MSMLNSLKQFVKDKKIRGYQRKLPLRGPIATNGFLELSPVSNEVPCKEAKSLNSMIQNSKALGLHFESEGIGAAIHFNDVLLYYPHLVSNIDPQIVSVVRSYLGVNVKLDAVYLGVFNTRKNNNTSMSNDSGIFHHDSVGNRLKLFVPINDSGNMDYPTCYMAGSHLIRWGTYSNPTVDGNRIELGMLAKWREQSVVVPCCGRFIFDTNGIHRGNYVLSNEYRSILQFEFSAAENLGFGQIGAMDYHLHKSAFDYLQSIELLRSDRCTETTQGYHHSGLSHRASDASFTSLDFIER